MDRLAERLEFRNTWSNQPYFNRGNDTTVWKNQAAFPVGMVAIVGPKR